MSEPVIHIIGAGLAGSEAAWYLANQGYRVLLQEMRPQQMTQAHHTEHCAELVCSNSFKSKDPHSAPGMLKAEMRLLNSLILEKAEEFSVPGGQALAVDRNLFSQAVTEALQKHPNIEKVSREVKKPEDGVITLIATGPLTSESLSQWLIKATSETDLYFYDAIAPILDASTLDPDHYFLANRYDKGDEQAYLNCPLNQEEYEIFIDALLKAEKVQPKPFEKEKFFQGCQPIEAIANTGRESLRFGPMKPVGLTDPKTGKRPHAVIQLRPENKEKTAYNMVGFQTKLKYGEQSRVFRLIPALKNVEFLRLGSIHRNTYVCGPKVLNENLSLKNHPNVFLAGQITGVEGYLESAACGLLTALFIDQKLKRQKLKTQNPSDSTQTLQKPPTHTALGALHKHITAADPKNYQPSNIHFGLFEVSEFTEFKGLKRDQLREKISEKTPLIFKEWLENQK